MHMPPARAPALKMLLNEARNLHAIQKNARSMMLRVIDRLDHYPEAKARLEAHLGDKDAEMRNLERLLESEGESASGTKDALMSGMGGMTAMMTGTLDDDIIRTSLLTFGLAQYEVAAYEGMILLAKRAGKADQVALVEDCLTREKAMAEWLRTHMAPTLERFLELSEREVEAAH
jgi:ferritin-like metal-binding protein YciE